MLKRPFILFIVFCLLLTYVFRSLLANFSSNLFDWYDYTFVTWLINRNIDKMITLNFSNFSNLNIFFPNLHTLYFSETLLTQSILGLPIHLITSNPIVIFNFVFFITLILNYISLFLFWRTFFYNNLIAFFGSVFIVFSPFFFLEIGHFQMISYWPFFFSLFYLFKSFKSNNKLYTIFSGLFCGLQFLASAYIGIFLLYTIFVYILLMYFYYPNKLNVIKKSLIIITGFLLVSGIFIKGYIETKNQYLIIRNPNEFIQYSAHVSDYIFTSPIRSIIHGGLIKKIWNRFDKNTLGGKASFPGFTLTLLALISIINYKSLKKSFDINVHFDVEALFFMLLLVSGVVFSWGPRINFNGNYAHIPNLYYIPLKIIPFLDAIRAPCRWSFLFYIGVVYFALKTLNKIFKHRYVVFFVIIISTIFFLEYIPINLKTHSEIYITPAYSEIKTYCDKGDNALLEVPITHFDGSGGIMKGLNRVVKYELSSLYHKCNLINGYSGYDLPSLISFKDNFYQVLSNKDAILLINLLRQNKINIIKIDRNSLSELDLPSYILIYPKLGSIVGVKEIYKDVFFISP